MWTEKELPTGQSSYLLKGMGILVVINPVYRKVDYDNGLFWTFSDQWEIKLVGNIPSREKVFSGMLREAKLHAQDMLRDTLKKILSSLDALS